MSTTGLGVIERKNSQAFLETFANFGESNEADDDIIQQIETFVCAIYGFSHLNSVDQVRKEIFLRKYEREGKTIDLSLLPPCSVNLHLHTRRTNYVENIYKKANNLMMNLEDPSLHGWNNECQ